MPSAGPPGDPSQLSVATQLVVCLGPTQADAEGSFKASPVYEEWTTVGLSGVPLEGFLGANLIGTPEEVCRRGSQAGASCVAG